MALSTGKLDLVRYKRRRDCGTTQYVAKSPWSAKAEAHAPLQCCPEAGLEHLLAAVLRQLYLFRASVRDGQQRVISTTHSDSEWFGILHARTHAHGEREREEEEEGGRGGNQAAVALL